MVSGGRIPKNSVTLLKPRSGFLGGKSRSFLWRFEQCCTIRRMAQVTYRDLPDNRVGDWKSKRSKVNITNWPEWVCSQLYTLFAITPQCLEAFFLPYKLNLNDNFQRTNRIWPKNFSQKVPSFFCWFVTMKNCAPEKKQKSRQAPPMECPLCGRPAMQSAPRNFSGFQWNRSSRARSARKTQSGSSWGAVVGWEFLRWFRGSLGNSPAKNQFSRTPRYFFSSFWPESLVMKDTFSRNYGIDWDRHPK